MNPSILLKKIWSLFRYQYRIDYMDYDVISCDIRLDGICVINLYVLVEMPFCCINIDVISLNGFGGLHL